MENGDKALLLNGGRFFYACNSLCHAMAFYYTKIAICSLQSCIHCLLCLQVFRIFLTCMPNPAYDHYPTLLPIATPPGS